MHFYPLPLLNPLLQATQNNSVRSATVVLCLISLAGLWLKARKAEIKAKNSSITDRLTGLPNRAGLEDKIEEVLRQSKSANISDQIAIVSIDLNGFKKINDTLGHKAGDLALQHFSEKLRAFLPKQIFLARPGGDEFIMILSGHSAAFTAHEAMRKFKRQLDGEPLLTNGKEIPIKFSYGVDTIYPRDIRIGNITADNIWEKADRAMYTNKQQRRSSDKHTGVNADL